MKPPTHCFPSGPRVVGGMVLGHAELPDALRDLLPSWALGLNAGAPPIIPSPKHPTLCTANNTGGGTTPVTAAQMVRKRK